MQDFPPQAKALFQMDLMTTSEKPISLTNSLVQHVKSTLNESMAGNPVCYHRFNTTQVDIVDKTIKSAMVDGNPFVRYRVGFVTPTGEFWLPWQNHQIVHYSAIVHGMGKAAGHAFELSTADRLYTLNRATKIVARKGTISSMVQQIASDAGLDAVIEATKDSFSYVQVNESDVEFVRRRLLSRAINDKGRGLYSFYIKDNVLHFHSPDYQSSLRKLSYFEAPHQSMVQIDRSQQLWDAGVSGTRIITYDPYTGDSKEIASDPEKYLRMANGVYKLNNVKNGSQTLCYHLSTNQPSESSAIGQNYYSEGRSDTFEIRVSLSKSITVRIGDLLQFILAPTPEKTSPWSGYYVVSAITREIEKQSMSTVYTLKRGEIEREKSTITQPNSAAQLVPETTAPGQDLNLAAAQTSVLTAGAGQQESATVYLTVADSNKAPGA